MGIVSPWWVVAIVLLCIGVVGMITVCSGLNWNDDERQAEAEGLSYGSGQGSEHNGTARSWPSDSLPAQNDDRYRTSLGTDGGDPR